MGADQWESPGHQLCMIFESKESTGHVGMCPGRHTKFIDQISKGKRWIYMGTCDVSKPQRGKLRIKETEIWLHLWNLRTQSKDELSRTRGKLRIENGKVRTVTTGQRCWRLEAMGNFWGVLGASNLQLKNIWLSRKKKKRKNNVPPMESEMIWQVNSRCLWSFLLKRLGTEKTYTEKLNNYQSKFNQTPTHLSPHHKLVKKQLNQLEAVVSSYGTSSNTFTQNLIWSTPIQIPILKTFLKINPTYFQRTF